MENAAMKLAGTGTYLRHVDGLRGVSVLLVVLYHAWPDTLPGGFVGVDVFFVISGFLITRLLLAEQAAGTLTYGGFLVRRVRRLWPSFALVVAATLALGWVILDGEALADLGRTVLAATGLSANWYFALTTDYFNEGLGRNLLLHTWSLAVEEQFYLLYPLLLVFLTRIKGGVLAGLCALWTLSFGSVLVFGASSEAFFATHLRVWQLASGALLWCAMSGGFLDGVFGAMTESSKSWLGRAGLGLILLTALLMPRSLWWPSALALVPVLGAVLCIWFPLRGLEAKWLTGLGLISYALYLWHWPVLKALEILWPRAPDGALVGAILISIGLAFLAWRYVEEPIRRGVLLGKSASLLSFAGVGALILAGVGWQYHAQNGFPDRFPSDIERILATSPDKRGGFLKCQRGPDALAKAFGIQFDHSQGSTDLVVCSFGDIEASEGLTLYWGDSHLGAIEREMAARAGKSALAGWSISLAACPALPGLARVKSAPADAVFCEEVQNAMADLISADRFSRTVLVSHWDEYARAGEIEPEVFDEKLDQFLKTVDGQTDLHILLDIPTHDFNVPAALARARKWPWMGPPNWLLRADHEGARAVYTDAMRAAAKARQLTLHDPLLAFCPEAVCLAEIEAGPLFYDATHPSEVGAAFLFDRLPALPQ